MPEQRPSPGGAQWFFRAALLILGGAIALQLAVAALAAIWRQLVIALACAALVWCTVAVLRWRRSRW